MPEQQEGASTSEEPILETVAREAGEPGLFPEEVRRLHREGKGLRARRALLKSARDGSNERLARLRREKAADLRLWVEGVRKAPSMYTLNGIGTRLYGSYQKATDGTYIGTLWVTVVFIPIFPIAAYLVLPAPKGGWHFIARSPLPPAGRAIRRIAGGGIAVFAAVLLWGVLWSVSHVDVHAYNGYDRAVTVKIGDEERVVPPRSVHEFSDLPARETALSATWVGEAEPFEEVEADLAEGARRLVLYNVGSRGLLEVEYITYGEDDPSPGYLLGAGPILIEEEVDYLFGQPPDSLSVVEGGTIERSVLSAIQDFYTPVELVGALIQMGRPEQAHALAVGELTAHPENVDLMLYTAYTLLQEDPQAQFELAAWCRDRAPEVVDLHRMYQEFWPGSDREPLRAEYAALLAENPGSASYHYLAGRLEDTGSDEALAHFDAALAIEPDHPWTIRALGYRAAYLGDWAGAIDHYDRYSLIGSEEALTVFEDRVRARVKLGRSARDIDNVIAQTIYRNEGEMRLHMTRAHLQAAGSSGRVERITTSVIEAAEAAFGTEMGPDVERGVLADLRLTTGDVDGARQAIEEIEDPAMADLDVLFRLALSDGATREDLQRVTGHPNWPFGLGYPITRLVALAYLPPGERGPIVTQMGMDVSELVELLDRGPTDADALRVITAEYPLGLRVAAYFAAAHRLAGQGEGTAPLRRSYLAEARSLALPGELPYSRR